MNIYVGQWKNDCQEGKGTLTLANGNVFKGEWKNCLPDGKCTLTYSNGSVHLGEWDAGTEVGNGKYIHLDTVYSSRSVFYYKRAM